MIKKNDMDNNLQNAIENLRKILDFQLPKFDIADSNIEIPNLNDLSEKLRIQIVGSNQNIGEHLTRASELGNSLKSITESWRLSGLVEQLQNNIQYFEVKGNIDSSAGIPKNYFSNFNPIDLDKPTDNYKIYWN